MQKGQAENKRVDRLLLGATGSRFITSCNDVIHSTELFMESKGMKL